MIELREFKSIFKNEFQNLINLKRAEHFKYGSEELMFLRIDEYFCNIGLTEKRLTKDDCAKWCKYRKHESPSTYNHRISGLRIFTSYLKDLGYDVYVPTNIGVKVPKYNAHIYTDDELRRFFKAVDQSQSVPDECPYRALVMPLFFRILYTSGFRLSELRLLKVKDFHIDEGYITVRYAKNSKERNVPVHPELVRRCRELKNSIHQLSDDDEYFFMIRPHTPMTLQNVYHNFRRYLEKAGISHTGKGPRVHDFRHTYCVNLIRKWSSEGKNLMNYMPYMKTMLGHETFLETAYYLKLTHQLFPDLVWKMDTFYPKMIEVDDNDKEFY